MSDSVLQIERDQFRRRWLAATDEIDHLRRELSTAEHRVRAAVIADLKSLLDRSVRFGVVDSPDYVYADSIRNLVETLEAQQS